MTTAKEIREWLEGAKKKGATHMLVVCDTFDWSDYPVYVLPGKSVDAAIKEYHGPNMQKVMEVYNMAMDLDEQARPGTRVWND